MTSAVFRNDANFDDSLVQPLAGVVAAYGHTHHSRGRDCWDYNHQRPFVEIGVVGRHDAGCGGKCAGSDEQSGELVVIGTRTPAARRSPGKAWR